jgi:hypothetical protein
MPKYPKDPTAERLLEEISLYESLCKAYSLVFKEDWPHRRSLLYLIEAEKRRLSDVNRLQLGMTQEQFDKFELFTKEKWEPVSLESDSLPKVKDQYYQRMIANNTSLKSECIKNVLNLIESGIKVSDDLRDLVAGYRS